MIEKERPPEINPDFPIFGSNNGRLKEKKSEAIIAPDFKNFCL
jgi:hypothetical protein